MIISGFSYNGKLNVKKVEKNIKINLYYYQKYILASIFKEEIQSLYPNYLQYVKFHQEKAPSHTYKPTSLFF